VIDLKDKNNPNYANMMKLLALQKELMYLLSEIKELKLDNFLVMKEHNRLCQYRNELSDLIKNQSIWERRKIGIDTTEIENYIENMKKDIKNFKSRIDIVWAEKRLPNNLKQVMFKFEDELQQ
jgi:hypothetical protein